MNLTLEPLQKRSIALPPTSPPHDVECQRQLESAQREMGAFVLAIRKLFGRSAGECAAEYWVQLAETMRLPEADNGAWRLVTIQAASKLATGFGAVSRKEQR